MSQRGEQDALYLEFCQLAELEKFQNFLDDNKFERLMTTLATDSAAPLRATFSTEYARVKAQLNPMRGTYAENLLAEFHKEADSARKQALGLQVVAKMRQLEEGAPAQLFQRLFGETDRQWAAVAKLSQGSGRSNRARRARAASQLFTRYAGLSRVEGAATDGDGNAVGSQYDLGADGAFDGLTVVVLQLYAFDFSAPMAALRQKGFDVRLRATTRRKQRPVTPSELDALLQGANQFWLISGSANLLAAESVEVVVRHWRDGMGVYLYGDNQPFYTEANAVLAAMLPPLAMAGNYPGAQTVGAFGSGGGGDEGGAGGGFKPHLLTTGLVRLFEGVTVARFEKGAVQDARCREVLRDHDGNIVVIARDADAGGKGCGPLLADGAFTKLYCNWDGAGSARFVINCACWLAADMGGSGTAEQGEGKAEGEGGEGAAAGAAALEAAGVDLSDGLCVTCDISLEDGVGALLAAPLSDGGDTNTSDFALDNALGMGRANRGVLGRQLYSLPVARLMVAKGEDPFRRVPATTAIPLLRLRSAGNRRLVGAALCRALMGGKRLTQTAWLIFLSMCDERLAGDAPAAAVAAAIAAAEVEVAQAEAEAEAGVRAEAKAGAEDLTAGDGDGESKAEGGAQVAVAAAADVSGDGEGVDHPQAFRFMRDQILAHITSTSDFGAFGARVPLRQAMTSYVGATDAMQQLRKSFSCVCLITRMLALPAAAAGGGGGEGGQQGLPLPLLRRVARRSLLKLLVCGAMATVKRGGSGGDDAWREQARRLLYRHQLGIAVAGTSRPVPLHLFLRAVVADAATVSDIMCDAARVARALRCPPGGVSGGGSSGGNGGDAVPPALLSTAQLTLLCVILSEPRVRWLVSPEALLTTLSQTDARFARLWEAEADQQCAVTRREARSASEATFAAFSCADDAHVVTPPFATCFGPSVFRCVCGLWFVEGGEARLADFDPRCDDAVAALKSARNAHFRDVYESDSNGYPTRTSAHYPLHRAVQRVLTRPEFATLRHGPQQRATGAGNGSVSAPPPPGTPPPPPSGERAAEENVAAAEAAVGEYLRRRCKGNVHCRELALDVRRCVDSYLRLRACGAAEPEPDQAVDYTMKVRMEHEQLMAAAGDAAAAPAAVDGAEK